MCMKKTFAPLFKCDSDIATQACLDGYDHHNLNLFATGYKQAADQLVINMSETGSGRDSLVFPILFLYRHYLELRFKDIIIVGAQLLDDRRSSPEHHKLKDLWPVAQKLARRAWPKSKTPPEFELIDHIVSEFIKFDPESFAFRYPTKRGTRENPLKDLQYVNLSHVAEEINKASELLDGISVGLSEYLSDKIDKRPR